MLGKKNVILCGHYGSGKSEVASNIALKSTVTNKKLYDLDITNPYFRNNILIKKFKENGIKFVSGTVEGLNADLPSLPNIQMEENEKLIIDLGGDAVGATVLRPYFKDKFKGKDIELFLVVNCNRYETKNEEGIIKHLKSIEYVLDTKITGLISNTHFLKKTEIDDIVKGYKIVKKIEEKFNIPIVAITYPCEYVDEKELKKALLDETAVKKLFPLNLNIRENWMD